VDVVITDEEIKIAKQGAMSAYRSGRGVVDLNDLVGEANLWMVSHIDKVMLWSGQGKHGKNKLRNACRQRCLSIIARERRIRSGLEHGDIFYYSAAIIKDIIPDIFSEDDWTMGSIVNDSDVKGPSRPSEGNNRMAMIADVRAAFYSLTENDRQLMSDLYQDGGLPLDVVAAQWDVTERTIRRREDRILEKMVERLGGDAPWAK
jgi:RNA polymerase sigma factor (sigma-70 family)